MMYQVIFTSTLGILAVIAVHIAYRAHERLLRSRVSYDIQLAQLDKFESSRVELESRSIKIQEAFEKQLKTIYRTCGNDDTKTCTYCTEACPFHRKREK